MSDLRFYTLVLLLLGALIALLWAIPKGLDRSGLDPDGPCVRMYGWDAVEKGKYRCEGVVR